MSIYKLFKYFNNNSVIAVNSLNNYFKKLLHTYMPFIILLENLKDQGLNINQEI